MKRRRKDNFCLLLILIILVINTINVFILIGTLTTEEDSTLETSTATTIEPVETEEAETFRNEKDDYSESRKMFEDKCRLTHAEAGNQIIRAQIAVAATYINRQEDPGFPDTFYEVMNQPGQFSPVWDGEIHVWDGTSYVVLDFENVHEQTINAVQRAESGEDPTEKLLWEEAERLGLDPVKYAEGGALFFYNPDYCGEEELEARSAIKVKVEIDDLVFYKYWDLPEK